MQRLAAARDTALIERWFPYRELSLIAEADRRLKDSKYTAHTWWARRPPGVFRGILLAAALPPDTLPREYWRNFETPAPWLEGLTIADDFAGGGTTVLEASRLGANVLASDIDPLAVEIVKHQLAKISASEVREVSERLLAYLHNRIGHLFDDQRNGWTTVHNFYLKKVTCPICNMESPLYRDLIVARNPGKIGSVARDIGMVAFCPDCLCLHQFASADRKRLKCCGKYHRLTRSTFQAQRFICPNCGEKSSHRELRTGTAPRILLAVEDAQTILRGSRRFRSPSRFDRDCERAATAYLARNENRLKIPRGIIPVTRVDDRPRSYGIKKYRELFSDRQLALFGLAFEWIRAQKNMTGDTRRAITLAVSSALATNNLLCGYARDYGRLSPLFSIRGYSLPALSVELNPLQGFAGRGTLSRTFERVCNSASEVSTRHIWSVSKAKPIKKSVSFDRSRSRHLVELRSALATGKGVYRADISVFDPPYFNYIAYHELSDFFRCWHRARKLGGSPLFPSNSNPVESFADHLSQCLRSMWERMKAGRPMVFSFHSASSDAWAATGAALDGSDSLVTALWPVKTDSQMGHHSSYDTCEWDLVIVIRRRDECRRESPRQTVGDWFRRLRGLSIREVDKRSMRLALEMAHTRFGRPVQMSSRRRAA